MPASLAGGRVTQAGKVMDMFKSVGLNVNNPYFLIMQGRINEVSRAKPREILSMIEDAAGTRLYEEKKASLTKLLEQIVHVLGEHGLIVEFSDHDRVGPGIQGHCGSPFPDFRRNCDFILPDCAIRWIRVLRNWRKRYNQIV